MPRRASRSSTHKISRKVPANMNELNERMSERHSTFRLVRNKLSWICRKSRCEPVCLGVTTSEGTGKKRRGFFKHRKAPRAVNMHPTPRRMTPDDKQKGIPYVLEGVEVSLYHLQLPCLGRRRVGSVSVPGRDAVQLKGRVVGRCKSTRKSHARRRKRLVRLGFLGFACA